MSLYFLLFPAQKKKYKKELSFLRLSADTKNKITYLIPYDFTLKYNHQKIEVQKDHLKGLFFVMHNGKKLYYSSRFTSIPEVQKRHNNILIEQDEMSPHRYLSSDFNISNGDIFVEIGAAEGSLSLDVVEIAKEIYIFESDNNWIEALEATFENWKEKVKIINQRVSNRIDRNNITLDTYFRDKPIDFIKMDVEGSERQILEGATNLLNARSFRLSICTYHNQDDAFFIKNKLHTHGFECTFTEGYMLAFFSNPIKPPYFRKGVLYSQK